MIVEFLTVFLPIFLVLTAFRLIEYFAHYRAPSKNFLYRLSLALSLSFTGFFLAAYLTPWSLGDVAAWAEERQFGLLNTYFPQLASLPLLVHCGYTLILLDFCKYLEHRLLHAVPFLWRIHRVHHSDTEIDVSVSMRFHPMEMLLGNAARLLVIMGIGLPLEAVIWVESVRTASNVFQHANIRLPRKFAWLSYVLVTPDFHHRHHGEDIADQHSNFGNVLSVWDWLFSTANKEYREAGMRNSATMRFGCKEHSERYNSLLDLFLDPFRADAGSLVFGTRRCFRKWR